MRRFWTILILMSLSLLGSAVRAGELIEVGALHYWHAAKQARMMIDVTAPASLQVAVLEQPARLVIDIPNAHMQNGLTLPAAARQLFGKVKTSQHNQKVRIIAELKKPVSAKSYSLQANKMYGQRLVIDLIEKNEPVNLAAAANSKEIAKNQEKATNKPESNDADSKTEKPAPVAKTEPVHAKAEQKIEVSESHKPERPVKLANKNKGIIVAIDAGHGGEDPGAHGANGTEEKQVVFAIAQKLAALINAQTGMKAVMVRSGDYYVDLRKRMKIARAANADLFVSIHADAFQNADVSGASVFTLSNKGASSEAARWLANSENASDLVGGVNLDDKDDVLASVLLDLSQTATLEASNNVARKVLKNFENIGELHYKAVQKAGFLVLKSPDIPSILVETAFISNPSEELKLINPAHQSTIAKAIFKGIHSYFKQVSPGDLRIAAADL